jgi:hypothetical protein
MATIKVCDRCGATDGNFAKDGSVRGFRWMGLMDRHHYKHEMQIKADLCVNCNTEITEMINKFLNLS